MKLTLKEGIRLVQSRINACQNYDRERLLDTIHLAQLRLWQSGKWWGSMDRLVVRIIEGRIVLPSEYGVMQAINWQGVPKMIHPIWYEFSPNGPGTANCWEHTGIFDLQNVPTLFRIFHGEQVFARSLSKNGEEPDALVTVQGINSDGNEIYRYYQEDNCGAPEKKSDVGEQIAISTIQENGQYSPAYKTYNAFARDGITEILKPQTRGPVEIYAQGPRYARKLVTLQPNQTQSVLRAYRVPEGCRCGRYVEVLARKAEPERPQHDHEILQVQNPNALISACLSVYYLYDASFDPQKSALYLTQALADLNGQLQENISPAQQRVQVWTPVSYARNKGRNVQAY